VRQQKQTNNATARSLSATTRPLVPLADCVVCYSATS